MVNQIARLELLVVDSTIGTDAQKTSEYRRIDRTVNQTTGGVAHLVVDDERMRLGREYSTFRKLNDHAHTPRIAPQKPVTQRTFHLLIGRVTGQFTVKDALGQHRRGQIVRAPYSRNAEHKRMILAALIDTLDARTDVPYELRRDLAAEVLRDAVMPHIHKRIPLVVAGAVGSHPRGHRLAAGIFNGLGSVLLVAGAAEHLVGGQLHIIHPVILLVDVRGNHRGGLADTWLGYSGIVGGLRLGTYLLRKLRIERLQDLCAKGEVRSELSCGAGYSGRLVLVPTLASLLRLTGAEPHRPALSFSPTIVSLVVIRDTHSDMVTVIRDLIVHLTRLRVHLVKPFESPVNLIYDVRNPVPTRRSVSQMIVRECLRIALIGEHHLVNRVG